MSSYTEEDLSGLTPEERESLLAAEAEGDDTTTTLGDSINAAQDEPGAEGGEAEKAGADKDAAKTGADDGAGDDAGGDAGDGSDAPAADADPAPAEDRAKPLLIAEAPSDAEAKLNEIDSQKAALAEKFDNGDITAKEFQNSLDSLNKEERTIERAMDKAQIAADMLQQQQRNQWGQQVETFTSKDHPEYTTSRVRWMALDAFVKEIGSNPENANLSGAEILRQAHERVVADLGESAAKPAQGQKPLKGSSAQPPKTLGKVPASDNAELGDGRWASLDRLRDTNPEAHEDALMRLSDRERDDYLAR